MKHEFAGRTAIVTGAGRGIGKSIAEAFAEAGANVMVATRTASTGQQVVDGIRAQGGTAELFALDIGEKAAVEKLVHATAERFGGIDIVVHSAADIPHGLVMEIDDEAIDAGVDSIIKASFWFTQLAVPHMKRSGAPGRLVFISSICGPRIAIPKRTAYGVCKAGLNAFVRGAALELAREGITVNGIEPGLIASGRVQDTFDDAQLSQVSARIPVGARAGTTREIADAVLFLAAPESAYITGQMIAVDGGSTLSTGDISSMLRDHARG